MILYDIDDIHLHDQLDRNRRVINMTEGENNFVSFHQLKSNTREAIADALHYIDAGSEGWEDRLKRMCNFVRPANTRGKRYVLHSLLLEVQDDITSIAEEERWRRGELQKAYSALKPYFDEAHNIPSPKVFITRAMMGAMMMMVMMIVMYLWIFTIVKV